MGRFATARVVVVADAECALVAAIGRMGVVGVKRVARIDTAQAMCDAGDVDACIVVLPKFVPDDCPPWTAETEAPGRGRVPSLLLADPVTPYVRQCARTSGYVAAVPLGLSSRMLYRTIGALLQTSVVPGAPPHWIEGTGALRSEPAGLGKPRLQ